MELNLLPTNHKLRKDIPGQQRTDDRSSSVPVTRLGRRAAEAADD